MPEPDRAQPTKGERRAQVTTSALMTRDLRAPDHEHRRMAHYTAPPGVRPGNNVIRRGRARAADSDESSVPFSIMPLQGYSNLGSEV